MIIASTVGEQEIFDYSNTYKNAAGDLLRYNKANHKTVIIDPLGSILAQNNTTHRITTYRPRLSTSLIKPRS